MRIGKWCFVAVLVVTGLCMAEEKPAAPPPSPVQVAAALDKAAQEKAAKEDAEKLKWHGSAALGLTINKGNTDSWLFNLNGNAAKLLKKDEYRLGIDSAYGEQTQNKETTRSAANVHGFLDYKHIFTMDRLYGGLRVDASHDDLSELRYRVVLGPNVGYYFIKNDQTLLSAEIGPSYVTERKDDEFKSEYAAMRVSEHYEHKICKTWKVWQGADYLPNVHRFQQYVLTGQAGTEAAMTLRLSLRVTLTDKYDSEPAVGKLRNDFTTVTALVYRF